MPYRQPPPSSSEIAIANSNPLSGTVSNADEALLAALGYKQEFKREFTPLEVR